MPFCPNCGTRVDSDASFCVHCRANLRPLSQSQVSMKERGGALEDSIADYFRRMGFDVQPRVKMRDRFDVSHEIDVLASKREAFGMIKVAVECKYTSTPIDIKEVRNFHDKLSALGLTKGVFVSTGGFTADAELHAGALGIELWDMKIVQEKMGRLEIPQKDIIHEALPINLTTINLLTPRQLRNCNLLSETIQLEFRPYYFVNYHCFSQHTVVGNSVVLESMGSVVINGDGQIVDYSVSKGEVPTLPKRGLYTECAGIHPQTLTSDNLPAIPLSVINPIVDSTRVKDLVRMELVKSLSLEYKYRTTRHRREKVLKPRKKDVEILEVQPVKIPFLVGTYGFKNRTFTRICLASTGKFIRDETGSCLQCRNPAVLVCEDCGSIVCESHSKNCMVCGRNLCSSCVISKGIISRKYYCTEHQPHT